MPIIISNGSAISTNNGKCMELKPRYAINDLASVYTHFDPKLGKNVPTENRLGKGDRKHDSDSE